jgi:hypothetical protein
VYITGLIKDDKTMDGYIRETDISVYPYNSKYYKGVSSGALNLAIANERPIIAYPVQTLVETNSEFGQLVFTASDSYYELAREVKNIDTEAQTKKIISYAKSNSFSAIAEQLVAVYKSLA